MTIQRIKDIVEEKNPGSHYFDKGTMDFFGQRLSSFSVSEVSGHPGLYLISAPSYWSGELMGISKTIVNTENGQLMGEEDLA